VYGQPVDFAPLVTNNKKNLQFGVLKLLWLCTCQLFYCKNQSFAAKNYNWRHLGVASPQLVHVLPFEVWMLDHFEGGAGSALLL
jgi:hypothetical protein